MVKPPLCLEGGPPYPHDRKRRAGSWILREDERWQAFWIDDGPDEKLVFYCPECAEREFGDV